MNENRTEQDWASELWPGEGTDPDWPDDWQETGRLAGVAHGPRGYGVPPVGVRSGRHGPRGIALALTAAVALGAGAGAVYLYKSEVAGPASAASSPSPGAAINGAGGGAEESVMMLGRVLAVAHDTVTVGGGPGQAISARATSATEFTGTVPSLAQVRVGDTVTAEITVSGGVATLVRLQDPAGQP